MDSEKLKNIMGSLGNIKIPKIDTVLPNTYDMFDPSRKEYHSPEEIIEDEGGEFERPNFSEWECKICSQSIEEGYFWYYLRNESDEDKSLAVCSKECMDKFIKDNDCSGYEIYEYSRCTAYYKCEEMGNIRGMCETVENKTYQSILPIRSINHCEAAQAGTILATHKLTEVLVNFSEQAEAQYHSNKEMMEQNAKESSKQFKITTWMTVLVIVLTIVNLVPAFLNWGDRDYTAQLSAIELRLNELNTTEEINDAYIKLSEITNLLNKLNDKDRYNDERSEDIIKLLQSIEKQLNGAVKQ